MDYLILAIALMFPQPSHADSIELIAGDLTYHFWGYNRDNAHKLSSDGNLIDNPLLGIAHRNDFGVQYQRIAVFGGDNSVGGTMVGSFYERGIKLGGFEAGAVGGLYLQNNLEFVKVGENPFYLAQLGATGIVPVIGVNLGYKVKLNNSLYLKLNTLVTPILDETSLSVGFNF